MIGSRTLSYCWLLIVIIIVATAGAYLSQGIKLETNILKLMPEQNRNPLDIQAMEVFNRGFSRQIFFLLGASSEQSSQKAAADTALSLRSSNLFENIVGRLDEREMLALYQIYRPYQAAFITPADRELLAANKLETLKQRVLTAIVSPGFNAKILEQDPLLFFTNFLTNSMPKIGNMELRNNMIGTYREGRHYTLISARTKGDPFSLEYQHQFSTFYRSLENQLRDKHPAADIISVGMIHNAEAGTKQAQREISVIGTGSLIGILMIFAYSFRSIRPILYALIPIAVGIITATVVCLTIFRTMHIMTLVFGASLIGISIDYSLHFFAERFYQTPLPTPRQAITNILPGITLGLISSIIGYLAFFATSFPGLQQMALFSSTGLIAAYCCVVFWFPRLPYPATNKASRLGPAIAEKIIRFWERRNRLQVILIVAIIVLFSGAGISLAVVDDNLRSLDNTPEFLHKNLTDFETITGIKPSGQFFLVYGSTPEETLQHEEALDNILRKQAEIGNFQAFRSVSSQLPSIKQQHENFQLIKTRLLQEHPLTEKLVEIGYNTDLIENYKNMYEGEPEVLEQKAWKDSKIMKNAQWVELENQYVSLVNLFGVKDIKSVITATRGLSSVRFVDQVSDISYLFTKYRQLINILALVVCLLIFLMLVWRYRLKMAIKVIVPPLLAGAVAFAVAGFAGQTLNIFNSLALLMILGIGIDYSIFLAESKNSHIATMTGVLYSAITTTLSFGLLGLSSTPALQSIGISVFCGITTALFLAPLVVSGKPSLLNP